MQHIHSGHWKNPFPCGTTVPHCAVYVPQAKPLDMLGQVTFEALPCPTLLYVPLPLFPGAVRFLVIPADICGYLRIFASFLMYRWPAQADICDRSVDFCGGSRIVYTVRY